MMVAGGSFAIARIKPSPWRSCRTLSLLVSLVCLTLFLKRWQPVRIFRFARYGRVARGSDARPHGLPRRARSFAHGHRSCSDAGNAVEHPPFKALFAPGGALCTTW